MKACLLLVLLLLAACTQEPIVPMRQETIKIGVSLPSTGPAAATGRWAQNGIDLALERLTPEERQRITFIHENDECLPAIGITVAKKLVETDNVKFTLGPLCGSVILATNDYYDAAKVLRMQVGAGLDAYHAKGKYRFAFFGWLENLSRVSAEYENQQGAKTAAILYLDDDYGKESSMFFEKYFVGEIVAKESFARGDTDFRTQLLKIKQSSPDTVFLAAYGPTLVNVLKQLDELKIDARKVSLYNMEDTEVVKAAGPLIEGLKYPSPIDASHSEIKDWFEKAYQERYGIEPPMIANAAFDSFNELWTAINVCGEDVDCVHKSIKDKGVITGASGTFTIDEHGIALRTPVVKQVKDGRFVTV